MFNAKNIAKTGLLAVFLASASVSQAQVSQFQVSDQDENPAYYDLQYSGLDSSGFIHPVSLGVKDTSSAGPLKVIKKTKSSIPSITKA